MIFFNDLVGWKQDYDSMQIPMYIDHVKSITMKELIIEMTEQCEYVWCDIMPFNPYDYWGYIQAGVYIFVMILPVLILVCSVLCIACNKACCVSCSSWSCCFCSICSSICTFVFLFVCMIGPMVMKPVFDAMTTNFTQMTDDTM